MLTLILNKWIEVGLNLSAIVSYFSFVVLSLLFNLLVMKFKVKQPTKGKAFLLSLINVGAGQFYNRHRIRGVIFFSLFIGLVTYICISMDESLMGVLLIVVLISPLEALISGKSKPSKRVMGSYSGKSGDRKYDTLDQVMDDMNDQFNDNLNNNW